MDLFTQARLERIPATLYHFSLTSALRFLKYEDHVLSFMNPRSQHRVGHITKEVISDVEHQQIDWVGIHPRICPFLVSIHATKASGLQTLSQGAIKRIKVQVIEICKREAETKSSQGKHLEMLPAAQLCARYSKEVYSPNTIELVPAYLLLAEANLGLGNLTLVREQLSQAEWVVSKSPDCSHGVHQKLSRSLGHLHVLTGDLEAALHHFANDVYHSSEEYGLDSTCTCTGLFLLADVFNKQGNITVVRSLYSEVAHVLHGLLQTQIQNAGTVLESSYGRCQRTEQDKMLMSMLEFEEKDSRRDLAQRAVVAHCLAMLGFLCEDSQKALGFGSTALQASQLTSNHGLAESIQNLLQLAQHQQEVPPPCSDQLRDPSCTPSPTAQ